MIRFCYKQKTVIAEQTISEYMSQKYRQRWDKGNILPVGITDEEFIRFIIQYLLPGWGCPISMSPKQILEVALFEVLERYSRTYRAERKAEFKV